MQVNGTVARAAARIKVGDCISILRPRSAVTLELIEVPEKQVSRSNAADYYNRLSTLPDNTTDSADDEPEDW